MSLRRFPDEILNNYDIIIIIDAVGVFHPPAMEFLKYFRIFTTVFEHANGGLTISIFDEPRPILYTKFRGKIAE